MINVFQSCMFFCTQLQPATEVNILVCLIRWVYCNSIFKIKVKRYRRNWEELELWNKNMYIYLCLCQRCTCMNINIIIRAVCSDKGKSIFSKMCLQRYNVSYLKKIAFGPSPECKLMPRNILILLKRNRFKTEFFVQRI